MEGLVDIPRIQYEPIVRVALAEDIGPGDITTTLCVPEDAEAKALLLAKSPGVIAGLDVAKCAFQLLDPDVRWRTFVKDGDFVTGRRVSLAEVSGNARALLTAERVALNFIQRMSGVATLTACFAALVQDTQARIVDTRKTTPGLRMLEKYAVRMGGGHNHRLALYDSVLIKENHIRAAGSITAAISAARAHAPHTMKIEVETATLAEVEEALLIGADIILFDNMDLGTLRKAVAMVGGKAITEASGGVDESRVKAIAETGVAVISIGALTHSAPAMDISLDFAT
jgi:nicotinate-nucleotide pyrophosphorylase (carboxylating)